METECKWPYGWIEDRKGYAYCWPEVFHYNTEDKTLTKVRQKMPLATGVSFEDAQKLVETFDQKSSLFKV